MKGVVSALFGFIFLLALEGVSATPETTHKIRLDDVAELLSLKSELESNQLALDKINKVLAHLANRQDKYRSQDDFVEYLYYYTHRKLLKTYTKYPSIEETLLEGDYDCLTATSIYSILLSELSIDHSVIETNYHIFIMVNPDTTDEILIETTDPRYGFVKGQDEIQASKEGYLKSNIEERNTLISFDFNIERGLEQKELIGLLYYNQSIRKINQGDWDEAMTFAKKAFEYYSRTRVSTLISIIDTAGL